MHRKGRVHIDNKDLDYKFCRGSGAGGQHRNVTDSAVKLTHIPSGIVVRCESGRSQHANKATALEVLQARLDSQIDSKLTNDAREKRRKQVGSGMRADKVRTIRVNDNQVKDHTTGMVWEYKKYKKGIWD